MFLCFGSKTDSCFGEDSKFKKLKNYLLDYKNLLGEGKFSKVYKGVDELNQLPVAIKVMKNVKTTKIGNENHKMEFEMLKKVDSPNVIKVHSLLQSHHNNYIVSEFCWHSLEEAIKKKPFKQGNQFYSVALDILQGLTHLEESNILHRDIKPDNILLGVDGHWKIADFGFAINLHATTTTMAGTPYYMAPEVYLKTSASNSKSDVWSLGVVLYEMIFQETPFEKLQCNSEQSLKNAMLFPLTIPQGKISQELTQILMLCFTKDVESRPKASELLRLMKNLLLKKTKK